MDSPSERTMDNAIAERLDRLEQHCLRVDRTNRRLKACIVALASLGAAGLLGGAAKFADEPETIEVKRLVLRDQAGKVRADLTVDDRKNVVLFLMDEGGNKPIALGVTANGRPTMGLTLGGTNRQITLAFTPLQTAGLTLYDEKLTPRAQLSTSRDGTPVFELRDENNTTVFKAPREP